MKGPCMCGDTACPSCGPAQGYDLQFEKVVEAVCHVVNMDDVVEADDVLAVLTALGKFTRIADLLGVLAEKVDLTRPMTNEDIAYVNKWLNVVKPCEKHNEWPDPSVGCVSCYKEELEAAEEHDESLGQGSGED